MLISEEFFTSPPPLPVNDTTVRPFDCANLVALTIFKEFPLVDKTTKNSA